MTHGEKKIAKIIEENYQDTELPIKICLFQGLPKSDKMELIIQKCVELGVYKIIPVEMSRSVVKIDDKKKKPKVSRWQAISESAAKQSKRTIIPEINDILTYKQALQMAKDLDLIFVPYESKNGMVYTTNAIKEIKKDIAALKGGSSSEVIYCIDTDKYDSDAEVQKLNADIENFCHQNGYRFIWFCRDVEEVFLHTKVDDSKKKEAVAKFKVGNGLGQANEQTLSARFMARKKSNMLLVLDQVLNRK